MKVAFVHEYLNQFGGAERVLRVLCDMFPHAPIYTLLYDEKATKGIFKDRYIITSSLQKFPFSVTHHQFYPLVMPLAIEQFDFSSYDLVISLSASFAKGVVTKPHTKHICYCLTPPRFLWDNSQKFVEEFGYPWIIRRLLPPFLSYLRMWDYEASRRVDHFLSISHFVKQRISKYYQRDSLVIHPPVDTDFFQASKESGEYFLMVGRLVTYKKFDVAIKAFNQLSLPLYIAGVGPQLKHLKKIAGPRIKFLGSVSDEEIKDLYAKSKALIFPQEEDFGIVPLEAMASGKPVIAFRGGGAMETVNDRETGLFFDEQNEASLVKAVKQFESMEFNPDACRKQAEGFSISSFQKKFNDAISKL